MRGAKLDINTLSFYVNDTWAVNSNLTVNLGLRAEKVDSEATGGIVGLDTGAVVPRLGLAYDPLGNGQYTFQATYSHYTGKYSESQFAANTNVGTPNVVFGAYTGPDGQGLDFAPGFDPANYQTYGGEFPIQNVSSTTISSRLGRRSSRCLPADHSAAEATQRPRISTGRREIS